MDLELEELEASGLIFYRTITGSHAYGTNTPESDVDIKGFYWVDPSEYLGLTPPVTPKDGQINDERHNKTFYSLYRAFELLKDANPNMIEMLWMPQDVVTFSNSSIMPDLLSNRNLFISKQAYHSHAGYSRNQIKKAKGSNKKVHNPAPKEMPVKEDFCRVILLRNLDHGEMATHFHMSEKEKLFFVPSEENRWTYRGLFPFRPVPLKEVDLNLDYYHVASLEHSPNIFRLYHYGSSAKGVFRGNDMLVCESIPKEDEWKNIVGLLQYDKNEYDKALKDWHSYWDWMKFRNSDRWIDQEKGLLDYDCYLDSETEFLTDQGWKKYDEVLVEYKLATMDKNNVVIYQNFTDKHKSEYSGDIYTFESCYTRFSVTPNHHLYVSNCHRNSSNHFSTEYAEEKAEWKLETVDEYFAGRRSHKHIVVAANAMSEHACYKRLDLLDDDMIRLYGAYLSEGSMTFSTKDKRPLEIHVSQLEGGRICEYMENIQSIPMKVSSHNRKGRNELTYRFVDEELASLMFEECGFGSEDKVFPKSLTACNHEQVNLLVDVMIAGDGHDHPKGHRVYYSASKNVVEGLQLLLFKNGFATQIYGPYKYEERPNHKPMYQLFIPKEQKKHNVVSKSFDRPYSGWSKKAVGNKNVVCFSVPNGILITRNQNKIAVQGNSKNMTHCMRLMMASEGILTTGEPIIRFEGEQLDFLMKIRRGEFEYKELMEHVDKLDARLKELFDKSDLPEHSDTVKLDLLYRHLMEIGKKFYG